MSIFYIPEPCHENWDKMSPREKGRHCNVCSKVVVDFTRKSAQEISDIILGAEAGNVCGHFRVGQLDHQAQMKVFRKPANLFNRNWKYFAMTVLGLFMLGKKTEAQKTRGLVKISGGPKAVRDDLNTSATKITGTVQAPDHSPAGGAQIVFLSNGVEIGRTSTIANGTYVHHFKPGKVSGKKIDLHVSYRHYMPKEIRGLELHQPNNVLNIVLEEEMLLLGQVVMKIPTTDTAKASGLATQAKNLAIEITKVPAEACDPVTPASPDTAVKENQVPVTEPVEEKKTDTTKAAPLTIKEAGLIAEVFPNPAGTYATIRCGRQARYQVDLYDAKGALQMHKTFTGDQVSLDLAGLARGTYLVKVRDEKDHARTLSLVKQ